MQMANSHNGAEFELRPRVRGEFLGAVEHNVLCFNCLGAVEHNVLIAWKLSYAWEQLNCCSVYERLV